VFMFQTLSGTASNLWSRSSEDAQSHPADIRGRTRLMASVSLLRLRKHRILRIRERFRKNKKDRKSLHERALNREGSFQIPSPKSLSSFFYTAIFSTEPIKTPP